MRTRLSHMASAGALALLLASCTDVPDPVGPVALDALPRVSPQGGPPEWFGTASPAVLGMAGAVFADYDEVNNRLVFGAEHPGAANGIRVALSRMGVPSGAVEVRVVQPIHQLATLRDRWRPTRGGIQIHFGQFLCTMGFNADDGNQRSFITNSHCTQKQGGVQGTDYFQPLSSVDGTVIADEVEDPSYFRNRNGCPRGRQCRFSDAARALYRAGTPSERGLIARTSAANNGSLEVTGTFTVNSQDNTTTTFANGTQVNKVGRTTGWTQGNVTASCVNVNVSGTNITQLCQTIVENPQNATIVGGGDSGSGVFRITGSSSVQLVGILWGGSSDGKLFVFSPLKNIRDELGPINAVR